MYAKSGGPLGAFVVGGAGRSIRPQVRTYAPTRLFQRLGNGDADFLGALPSGFSIGNPATADYGSIYYNGSKLMGKTADSSYPNGFYWETVNGQRAPYNPGDEQAFSDAATAAFQSPEHQNFEYEQSAATASPAMRAVLLDPEYRSYAQFGKQLPPFAQLSPTLQGLIQAVPLLYESLTNVAQFNTDAQAAYAQEVAAKTAPQPLADQRIIKDGVVYDGNGKAVPSTDPYYLPPVSTSTAAGVIQEVLKQGGDPTQPTGVVDANSGKTVAVVQQTSNGLTISAPSGANVDLASIGNKVTGIVDAVAGTLQTVGTQIQKVGNAVKGAEAGASAGYNLPANATPWLVGAGVLAAVLLLRSGGRR